MAASVSAAPSRRPASQRSSDATYVTISSRVLAPCSWARRTALTIVEDGGEQVVLSATVAYVLWIALLTRQPRQEDAASTASG